MDMNNEIGIVIPSIVKPAYTSCVVISRETERFGSINELLTAERGSNSSRKTCALSGIKETCAGPPSNPVGDSLFEKTVIPGGERKWITIDADSSPRSGLPAKVSKMVTNMVRHYDQDERKQDGSYHWETVKSLLLR